MDLPIHQLFCHLHVLLNIYLCYGIITFKNRKYADSESQIKAAQDIDTWCKFHKHGNLLHIDSI